MTRAAGLALVMPDGACLFVKRAPNVENGGTWALPAGHVEADERPVDTAIREAREETGYIAPEDAEEPKEVPGAANGFATFKQRVTSQFIPTLNDEHTAWAWCPLDDPPLPLHPGLDKMLPKIAMDAGSGDDPQLAASIANAIKAGKGSLVKAVSSHVDADPVAHDQMSTVPSAGIPAAAMIRREAEDALNAEDMTPEDWRGLVGGLLAFFAEEAEEPAHAEDAEFEESKHPRDAEGKFGSGGGGGASASTSKKSAKLSMQYHDRPPFSFKADQPGSATYFIKNGHVNPYAKGSLLDGPASLLEYKIDVDHKGITKTKGRLEDHGDGHFVFIADVDKMTPSEPYPMANKPTPESVDRQSGFDVAIKRGKKAGESKQLENQSSDFADGYREGLAALRDEPKEKVQEYIKMLSGSPAEDESDIKSIKIKFFDNKDGQAQDMEPEQWRGLVSGLLQFLGEEMREEEHAPAAEDEITEKETAHGKLTERQESAIGTVGSEKREEMPEGVFLMPASKKYPVKEKQDGEWKYNRKLLLAAARRARMNGNEALAKRADSIRAREFGVAEDAGGIKVDAEHDGPWLSCMSKDGRRMYMNKNLPSEIEIDGKSVNVADMLLNHEVPEWKDLESLLKVFQEQTGRKPNDQEAKVLYQGAHDRSGTPSEKAHADKIGVNWKKWSAWCRGEEAKVEKGPFENQPEDADVRPIKHGHGELAAATDSALKMALDKDSVQERDRDGRLHVSETNVCKASIDGYLGAEIPDPDGTLNLDPNRIYQLFRSPEELEKAVATANGMPLLRKHIPVSAEDHQPWDVIGSMGTAARWDDPFIKNGLTVWSGDDIKKIENKKKFALSPGYHYQANMQPGTWNGEPFDGRMEKIEFNHWAVVVDGRQGDDIVIGDSAASLQWSTVEKAILELCNA